MSIIKTETNVPTLKINYLTQAMYDDALENDQINDNELYLTPNNSSTEIIDWVSENDISCTIEELSTEPSGGYNLYDVIEFRVSVKNETERRYFDDVEVSCVELSDDWGMQPEMDPQDEYFWDTEITVSEDYIRQKFVPIHINGTAVDQDTSGTYSFSARKRFTNLTPPELKATINYSYDQIPTDPGDQCNMEFWAENYDSNITLEKIQYFVIKQTKETSGDNSTFSVLSTGYLNNDVEPGEVSSNVVNYVYTLTADDANMYNVSVGCALFMTADSTNYDPSITSGDLLDWLDGDTSSSNSAYMWYIDTNYNSYIRLEGQYIGII